MRSKRGTKLKNGFSLLVPVFLKKPTLTIEQWVNTLKALLKIIYQRVCGKLRQDETQFGFQGELGTREALFAVNMLGQHANHSTYALYITEKLLLKFGSSVVYVQSGENMANFFLSKYRRN